MMTMNMNFEKQNNTYSYISIDTDVISNKQYLFIILNFAACFQYINNEYF